MSQQPNDVLFKHQVFPAFSAKQIFLPAFNNTYKTLPIGLTTKLPAGISSADTSAKGPVINYLRVQREGVVGKISTYSYFGGRGGQTNSYLIFSKLIFYIINRAVKWFGRDHISFI